MSPRLTKVLIGIASRRYSDSSSFFVSDLSVGGIVAWHSASSRLATATRSWSSATLSAAREPFRASTFPSSISEIADRVIFPFERWASSLVEKPIAVLLERIAAQSIDANAAIGRSSFLPMSDEAIGRMFRRVGKNRAGRMTIASSNPSAPPVAIERDRHRSRRPARGASD